MPVLGQLYIILATLMFFAIDGHLVLIALLTESFFLLPVGPTGLTRLGFGAVLDWSGTLFSGAVNIALPVIISLLVVNLAFGVMAKSAPQLNIFAVGFPVMILFGVFLVFLTLGNLEAHLRHHFDAAFEMTRAVLARP